jgi:hypothetical protein
MKINVFDPNNIKIVIGKKIVKKYKIVNKTKYFFFNLVKSVNLFIL